MIIELLATEPTLAANLTVHDVFMVGTAAVFFAVVFKRFGLATLMASPLVVVAVVHYFISGPKPENGARPVNAHGPKAHHHPVPWFAIGVGAVVVFLVFVLVVMAILLRRIKREDFDDWDDQGGWSDTDDFGGVPPYPDDDSRWRNTRGDGSPCADRPVVRADRDGGGAFGRLAGVTGTFLVSVRDGEVDVRSPATLSFLDALIATAGLVATERDRHSNRLGFAVDEVERRLAALYRASRRRRPT